MCDVKPGCRCATDSREASVVALDAYRRVHPTGPAVDPLTAAQENATVLRFVPTWREHDSALDDSADEARSLQAVADSLAEERRESWHDPRALARISADELQAQRELDATVVGTAQLQCSIDRQQRRLLHLERTPGPTATGDARVARERLDALEGRLRAAQERAREATRSRGMQDEDVHMPVGGGAEMPTWTSDRWRDVGMTAQARGRGSDLTYAISLVDDRQGREVARLHVPATHAEEAGAPDKARIASYVESVAGTEPAGAARADAARIRSARAALDALGIELQARRDA